jgi:hypothetical protein
VAVDERKIKVLPARIHGGVRTFSALLLFAVMAISAYSKSINHVKEKNMGNSNPSQQLLVKIISGALPSTDELIAFGKLPEARPALLGLYDSLRVSMLNVLIDLGRPLLPEDTDRMIPERQGPIVSDPEIIAYLVGFLRDTNRDIRNRASSVLAEQVPASLLKQHTKNIIAAIRQYPDMDGALLLLGKTDSPEALVILDSEPAIAESSSDNTIMVRARLGDKKAEEAILSAYGAATTPEEKGALALRLGYISTGNSTRLLAREIRSPEFYFWNQRSRRSLRVHIIEGLHQAYLAEQIFWKPFERPVDDSYYKAIEDWLANRLKITWDSPRPPFLYQEDAPSRPR